MRSALAALISGALLVAGNAATADEGPAAHALAQADLPAAGATWLSAHLDRVHLHKRSGLAYTTRVARADRDLELSLHGPAMGSIKRLGVAFEVRF